jgi:hypothetical protein
MHSSRNFIRLSSALLAAVLLIIAGMSVSVQAKPSAQATPAVTAGAGGSTGNTTGGMRFAVCLPGNAGNTSGGSQATSTVGGAGQATSAVGGNTSSAQATAAAGGSTGDATVGDAAGTQTVAGRFLQWIGSRQPGDVVTLTIQRTGTSGSTASSQATDVAGSAGQATSTVGGSTGGGQATAAAGGTTGGPRAYLGIRGSAVADCGVLILELFGGSPAASAGLQVGDIIVAVDGMALTSLPTDSTGGTAGGGQATAAAGNTTGGSQATAAAGGTDGSLGGTQEINITVTLGSLPAGIVPSAGGGVATMAATTTP